MPVKGLGRPQVATHSGPEATLAAPQVEIVAGGEKEGPQLAHRQPGPFPQQQDQGVGASIPSHAPILIARPGLRQPFVVSWLLC